MIRGSPRRRRPGSRLARQVPATSLATDSISSNSSTSSNLPPGTVTFLLADIEGSTRLWERYPGEMRAALVLYDVIVERVVREHSGVVVKPRGEGDSHFAVFARADDAISAACAVQLALCREALPTPEPLRVRMALHTGEADLRQGDYYGSAVNRCGRLRAIAHSGQVLVSGITAQVARDHLPKGVSLQALGSHRLRDLAEPEQVYQLCHPDLPSEFPPLRSLSPLPNNLPAQGTRFIGREREIAQIKRLLQTPDVRLVTLTGPGGSGKTRLAIEVAAVVRDLFADGIHFVDLSLVPDRSLVAPTIARALGLRETEGQPVLGALQSFLADHEVLLVLDNSESALDVWDEILSLLSAQSRCKMLLTSRARLRVRLEHVMSVPPLPVPDPERLTSLVDIADSPAVALFVDRLQLVMPGFELTSGNAEVVARLCSRLDGLPLALELAAACGRVLSLQALLDRLDSRLELPEYGPRDLPPRHRSLRATLDWSYNMLTTEEQRLLRRLAVFAGGWALEAAEEVCCEETKEDVLVGLMSLADKSLLRHEEQTDGGIRFSMLETIREYALRELVAGGEWEAIRQKHSRYYLALATQAEAELLGSEASAWRARLEKEHDNLRASLAWCTEDSRACTVDSLALDSSAVANPPAAVTAEKGAIALHLAAALERFWYMQGYHTERRVWLQAVRTQA